VYGNPIAPSFYSILIGQIVMGGGLDFRFESCNFLACITKYLEANPSTLPQSSCNPR